MSATNLSLSARTKTSNLFVFIMLTITGLAYAPYWILRQASFVGRTDGTRIVARKLSTALIVFAAAFYVGLFVLFLLKFLFDIDAYQFSFIIGLVGQIYYLLLIYTCSKYGNSIVATANRKPSSIGIFIFHVLYVNDWQNNNFREMLEKVQDEL